MGPSGPPRRPTEALAMRQDKPEVITFKASASLRRALAQVPNRSEFIRNAILSALESACPLCGGTGILTPTQRRHWEAFATHHSVEECQRCHALHLVCQRDEGDNS